MGLAKGSGWASAWELVLESGSASAKELATVKASESVLESEMVLGSDLVSASESETALRSALLSRFRSEMDSTTERLPRSDVEERSQWRKVSVREWD
jgi:hypothetical protein